MCCWGTLFNVVPHDDFCILFKRLFFPLYATMSMNCLKMTGFSCWSYFFQAISEDQDDPVQWLRHQLGLHNLCAQDFKTSQTYLKAAIALDRVMPLHVTILVLYMSLRGGRKGRNSASTRRFRWTHCWIRLHPT